tara:strand:- start:118 stop:561 length:444 start_codon:yes stop_codon:yes gene_type:complete
MASKGFSVLIFASADGFMVNDADMGRHHDSSFGRAPGLTQPQTQVHIVEDHSKVFIEPTDRIKIIGAKHQAGSGCGNAFLLDSKGGQAVNDGLALQVFARLQNGSAFSLDQDDALMLEAAIGIKKPCAYSNGAAKPEWMEQLSKQFR